MTNNRWKRLRVLETTGTLRYGASYKGDMMTTSNKEKTSQLVDELNKLGENLGNLLRSAWESDERKSIEREVTVGLEQMSKKLNEAAEKIRTDAYVNNAKRSVKDAYEAARVPQILEEMHKGVVGTLQKINADLAKRAEPAPEASADRVDDQKPD